MKLLHIDSSILGSHSVSRTLSAEIVAREVALHPGIEVTYRDLSAESPLHLTGAHVAVRHGSPVESAALAADLEIAQRYITEVAAADIIVIGAPMYNFTISSLLKTWIDRVVVGGQTFRYSETGQVVPLLPDGKKVVIASARGNTYEPGTPQAALEHHESYLIGVFSFIGMHDVSVIRAEGLSFGPEAKEAAIIRARAEIAALAA